MIKHHLPPGLNVNAGDEINGWILSFIEPRMQTELFPREIHENEVPHHYWFVLVNKENPNKHFPGFVPYDYLFGHDFSVFLLECIEKMEGRI